MSVTTYVDTPLPGQRPEAIPSELSARLNDPVVAQSLVQLLDQLDVINLVFDSINGLLANSESIFDNVVASAKDASVMAEAAQAEGYVDFKDIDAVKTLGASAQILSALPELAPALVKAGDSGVLELVGDAELVRILNMAAKAATDASKDPSPVTAGSALAMLRAIKDPEVARGISFVLTIAKHLGKQLS